MQPPKGTSALSSRYQDCQRRSYYKELHGFLYKELRGDQELAADAKRRVFAVLKADSLITQDDLWEKLKCSLIESVERRRMAKKARHGPGRPRTGYGSGSPVVGYYADAPLLTPIQVLMRKARDLGHPSQRALAEAFGISVTTVWRIIDASGVGWPFP